MTRQITQIGIALLLVLGLFAHVQFGTTRAESSTLVARLFHDTSRLSTDGTFVVWDDHLGGLSYKDVFATNLADREVIRLTEAPGFHDSGPDIDNGIVVWIEEDTASDCGWRCTRVRGHNLLTGERYDFGVDDAAQDRVSITGDWVVWMQSPQPGPSHAGSIMARNIRTMEPAVTLAQVVNLGVWSPLQVAGDHVLWIEAMGRTKTVYDDWTLHKRHITTGEESAILTGAGLVVWRAGGDYIIYSDYSAGAVNRALNVVTGETWKLDIPGDPAATDGRYAFTHQTEEVSDGVYERTLWGQDLVTGYRFIVSRTRGAGVIYDRVAARNGVVAWVADDEIHAIRIDELLHAAPQPDPGTTSRAWLYFKETGHYLSYGFKDFWLRNGGLPVFGYPLTTEFDELNPELGKLRTVQYTERQRFEYHPELADTPYETLLGRLGYADAKRRGLLEHPAFQPLPWDTRSDAHSDFFPQTRHLVKGRFREYWHSHGLDLGDHGMSYRESLALFGYPLSEEFVDPRTGLVTQYFERAVFEYHPDNPEPYKVLLRRLGAEEMVRRGWRHELQPEYERIAFVAQRDGYQDIFIIRDDGSGLANLTLNPAHDSDPVWSPDGTQIAFRSDRSGAYGIHVMDADGTHVRQLTQGPLHMLPSWSPNGRQIAFISLDGDHTNLYVVNADGSGLRRLNSLPHVSSLTPPTWSGDSTRIAYAVEYRYLDDREQVSVIHVVNLVSNEDKPLTLDLHDASRPAWAHDDSKIAFVQRIWEEDGEALVIMNPDGTDRLSLTSPGPGERIYSFAWSPTSDRLAAHREPGGFVRHDSQIVVFRLASEDEISAGGEPVQEDVIYVGDEPGKLTWAPDGTRLAFGGRGGGIWLINRDGTGLVQLTHDGWEHVWAPRRGQ
jgi:hypothetical protein